MHRRHFGGKNAIFLVILLRVFHDFWREGRSGGNMLSNVEVLSFCDREETSIYKNNRANFSGAKKYNVAFRGVYFLRISEKTLSQIPSLKSPASLNLQVSGMRRRATPRQEPRFNSDVRLPVILPPGHFAPGSFRPQVISLRLLRPLF